MARRQIWDHGAFIWGVGFERAANTLRHGLISLMNSVQPSTHDLVGGMMAFSVNSALSIEIYLKCLITLEGLAIPEHEHGLNTLHDVLPEPIRSELERHYRDLEMQGTSRTRRSSSYPDWLREVAHAFVQLRYGYEIGETESTKEMTHTLLPLAVPVRRVILRLRPEWAADAADLRT